MCKFKHNNSSDIMKHLLSIIRPMLDAIHARDDDRLASLMSDLRIAIRTYNEGEDRSKRLYYDFSQEVAQYAVSRLSVEAERTYERLQEIATASELGEYSGTKAARMLLSPGYHQSVSDTAGRELDVVQELLPIETRSTFIFVGCGAVSHTMICAKQRFSRAICIGIDHDNTSLMWSRDLLKAEPDYMFDIANGEDFDYSHASVVFMANALINKKAVLDRIVATLPDGGIVVVRRPVRFSNLLWDWVDIRTSNHLHCHQWIAHGAMDETVIAVKRKEPVVNSLLQVYGAKNE